MNKNKIKIYTKSNCSKCIEIKALCLREKIEYEEFIITGLNIGVVRKLFPDVKELPLISINSEYVSYPDFLNKLKNKEL